MPSISWYWQAICAGLITASAVAGKHCDLDNLWVVGWTFAAGFAAYTLGKFQVPPQ